MEYENHTSPTVWVKYAMTDDPAAIDPALRGKKVFTIIWTTTPWTLPASMAVAFHPDEEYVALESRLRSTSSARKLAQDVIAKCQLEACAGDRSLSGPQAGAHELPRIPFSIATYSACSPNTSPWIPAREWCIPRPRTALTIS